VVACGVFGGVSAVVIVIVGMKEREKKGRSSGTGK
jgi:hypothetical protein